MSIPAANPEQKTGIRRDIVILLTILAVLCCTLFLLAFSSYSVYNLFSAALATQQAQATAIKSMLSEQATATAQAVQATATAQAVQAQATATAQARENALSILKFTGLIEKRDALGKELTIADRKRLEMARSLATNPKLLLLDEVLAGLTSTETEDAIKLVRKIRDEVGLTILMIEHVMKAVMDLSDRVIVLHNGQKIAEGKANEVAQNPQVIEAYLGEKHPI